MSRWRHNNRVEQTLPEGVWALVSLLTVPVDSVTDHEWDAALSALAVLKGLSGRWSHDLHGLPTSDNERIAPPCGPTHYFWPE